MRILILHDFFSAKGGAEKVVLTLLKELKAKHDVSLVVGYINYSLFPELKTRSDIQTLGSPTDTTGWESLKMIWLFKYHTKFIVNYDVCIFSGIYSITASLKATPPLSIYYCHTPPRFVYDLKQYYLEQAKFWQIPLLSALRAVVRVHFEQAIQKMDHILANSENVQQRLRKFLFIQSSILYPPVATEKFQWLGTSDYYLSTARLEPYKRVDLIVKAFMQMPDKKLIISSSGRMLPYLQRLAAQHDNISFTRWTTEEQLRKLIGSCIATIYIPLNEDFGMSPVESMAAGKPVIAVNEGGIKETVIHNVTGILIPSPPSIADITKAVHSLSPENTHKLKKNCQKRASTFSTEIFLQKIVELIAKHKSHPS